MKVLRLILAMVGTATIVAAYARTDDTGPVLAPSQIAAIFDTRVAGSTVIVWSPSGTSSIFLGKVSTNSSDYSVPQTLPAQIKVDKAKPILIRVLLPASSMASALQSVSVSAVSGSNTAGWIPNGDWHTVLADKWQSIDAPSYVYREYSSAKPLTADSTITVKNAQASGTLAVSLVTEENATLRRSETRSGDTPPDLPGDSGGPYAFSLTYALQWFDNDNLSVNSNNKVEVGHSNDFSDAALLLVHFIAPSDVDHSLFRTFFGRMLLIRGYQPGRTIRTAFSFGLPAPGATQPGKYYIGESVIYNNAFAVTAGLAVGEVRRLQSGFDIANTTIAAGQQIPTETHRIIRPFLSLSYSFNFR